MVPAGHIYHRQDGQGNRAFQGTPARNPGHLPEDADRDPEDPGGRRICDPHGLRRGPSARGIRPDIPRPLPHPAHQLACRLGLGKQGRDNRGQEEGPVREVI